MFAKIFAQTLDSSIAEDYYMRHVFMDLLVIADKAGLIDMTPAAIARRTGAPSVEFVTTAIQKLCAPDPLSRSPDEDGRRLVLIHPDRPWGWRVVNYLKYRNMRDEGDRTAYFREYRRSERAQKRGHVQPCSTLDVNSSTCSTLSTHAEAEADVKQGAVASLPLSGGSEFKISQEMASELAGTFPGVDVFQEFREMRSWLVSNPRRRKTRKGISSFIHRWLAKEKESRGPAHPTSLSSTQDEPSSQPDWVPPPLKIYKPGDEMTEYRAQEASTN